MYNATINLSSFLLSSYFILWSAATILNLKRSKKFVSAYDNLQSFETQLCPVEKIHVHLVTYFLLCKLLSCISKLDKGLRNIFFGGGGGWDGVKSMETGLTRSAWRINLDKKSAQLWWWFQKGHTLYPKWHQGFERAET